MDHAAVVRAAMMWCAELLEAALEEPGDPEAREVFLADATGLRDRQEVVFVTYLIRHQICELRARADVMGKKV